MVLAALLLAQALSNDAQGDVELYKAASFEWRICTMKAIRERAWASDDAAEVVVAGAYADCHASYEKLRSTYEVATGGNFKRPPFGEVEGWRARMIARVPVVRSKKP